jgi:hypothetical protein
MMIKGLVLFHKYSFTNQRLTFFYRLNGFGSTFTVCL